MINTPPISLPNEPAPGAVYDPSAEGRRGFDFRHFWHSILERLWVVALCVVAGLFLALGYLARTPRLYQSHAVLEVEFQEPTMISGDETSSRVRSMFLASQEALRTIEQNLTNRNLMARVIRAEGLAEDGGRALLGKSVTDESPHAATPKPKAPAKDSDISERDRAFTPLEDGLGGALSTMVKPVIRRGTRLIDLYVMNQDPALAQRLAEAVGREYIRMSIERRANFSQESLRYLMEEEERLKGNLQRSEAAVADYKAKTPDALQLGGGAAGTGGAPGSGAGGGRGGLVEDKLQDLSSKVTSAKSDRVRLESELKQIDQVGDNIDALLAIPSIANAPVVVDRRKDVAQLESAVASLAQRYKSKHPKMMAARAALEEAQAALKRAVLNQPAVLRNVLAQAEAAEKSLGSAANEQEKAALALNKAAIGYQELARQAETDRALYESVLRQIKETNLTKDVKTNAVSIAEHATMPYGPASPKPFKDILLGLLGGLAAGLGCVYGADVLDRSLKTVDQTESYLALPVLAAVPETGSDKKKPGRKDEAMANGQLPYRLVAEAPEGPIAESFRNLRASLSLLGPEVERKIFLFTSAVPNEGKSFTSANYALSLAQQGHKVLLVDGDLRRPSLHKIFPEEFKDAPGTNNGKDIRGVVDYLVGETKLEAALRPVSAHDVDVTSPVKGQKKFVTATGGQLSILAGGRRAPNPAELLSGHSFGQLMEEASKLFDRVVVDSAPLLAVSDTLLMMPHIQTVTLVVRAAKTPRNAIRRTISLLAAASTRPAGVILNRLPHRRGSGYYYYYASHGYGAGEGSYEKTNS